MGAVFERVTRSQPQQASAYSSLTGLLAVNKPAGVTSTTIVDLVQFVARRNQAHPLVQRVLELDGSKRAKRGFIKVGHGGTLDPLARGVVGTFFGLHAHLT